MPLAAPRAGWFPGGRRPSGSHPRRLALALAVTALAGTAGCAAERPASAPPAAVVVLPDESALTALHALPPINGFLTTVNPVDRRITTAEQQLVADCMARQGHRYQPVTPPAEVSAESGPMPFGLETLPTETGGAPATPPPEQAQSEQFGRALLGDDAHRVTVRGRRTTVTRSGNGCIAEAQQRLLGDGRVRWVQTLVLLYEAQEDAREQLDADRGFQDANARWSDCMSGHGLAYPHPMALFDDLSGVTDLPADPRVRRDLACKAGTGYLRAAYERLATVQRRVLGRDPGVVRDWTALRDRQDTVARTVLAR